MQYNRPWLPDYQLEIIDDPARYTVTEGTTKAGKTVSHIIWLFEETLKLSEGQHTWWVAPVYKQAEIAYKRLKQFISEEGIFKANDSKLRITFINGAVMEFKTGENPDNLFGEDVYAVVMDEYTRMRQEAWYAIRSTLTATGGRCKFIGNVKGVGWGYQMARKAEEGADGWAYYKVTADDAVRAGILPQEEIDDARNSYPEAVFLELYYGIPNVQSSDRFAYSFKEEEHVGSTTLNPNYPVYLSFDFNYNPISCLVAQRYNGCIFYLESIKLPNSNIYNLCDVILSRYAGSMFIVTGDATGKANSALTKDNLNYYIIIKQKLKISSGRLKVPSVNPSLAENQVLVNACLEHIPMIIDADKCQPLIFDLKFVRVDNEGKIVKEDRKDPTQQADALDCMRYDLNTHERRILKKFT